MIVVAIIAVLAAVVIPSFFKESARSKAKSEVHPMFAELATRQDQYKVEHNAYLDMAACPASASTSGTVMASAACAITEGAPWLDLRVQAPQSKLTCSYTVKTGDAGADPTATGEWASWATGPVSALALGWYFIKAECPETEYLTASWDTKIQSKDGK